MTPQSRILGNTLMGDGSPSAHSPASQIHRTNMRLVGNCLCHSLTNPDHQPVTLNTPTHMTSHQKAKAAKHRVKFHFEHAANVIMQALGKPCIIHGALQDQFLPQIVLR